MSALVRPAVAADAPTLGQFGAALARQHHGFDPLRFMLPDGIEAGYRHWLARELDDPHAVVLVAQKGDAVVGYAYGRLEERDWNALRDGCGAFHDLWVTEEARGHGVGRQLAETLIQRLTDLGAPRVVLHTAAPNTAAQRLFAALGFRSTMIEMTREADAGKEKGS